MGRVLGYSGEPRHSPALKQRACPPDVSGRRWQALLKEAEP